MGMLKGKTDLAKLRRGEHVSIKHAIWAKCYECNGFGEGGVDCDVPSCPIYKYNPYKGISNAERP